ncbi:MAG TPA: TetR/AcrR family transcriptional regulator [Ramlibacter sp.]|nr:TetR/AcrR family transcriptional regulator [Ramlibacter sp.]
MPAPAKRRKQQPSGQEEIVVAIVDAAQYLFAKHPIDQVTTRQLAAQADVNLGMIHRYFGSKEEVLRALMQRYASYFRDEVSQAPDPMSGFQTLLADPLLKDFVRTLAFTVLSGTNLDDMVSHGAIREMVEVAQKSLGSNLEGEALREGNRDAATRVVAAWSVMFGWHLFQPFLLRAAGIPRAGEHVEKVIADKLQAIFLDLQRHAEPPPAARPRARKAAG